MPQLIRCFIAIEIPPHILKNLDQAVQILQKTGASVKWTNLSQIHLTLKFLGEISEDTVERIQEVIQTVVAHTSPLHLKIHGINDFRTRGVPRVIWVGCESQNADLEILAKDLDFKLALHGIPKAEKQFIPHITVGRIKSSKGIQPLREAISLFSKKLFGQTMITELVLFKSALRPDGPLYTALERFSFLS